MNAWINPKLGRIRSSQLFFSSVAADEHSGLRTQIITTEVTYEAIKVTDFSSARNPEVLVCHKTHHEPINKLIRMT